MKPDPAYWDRRRALMIRDTITKVSTCSCGSYSEWQPILEILEAASTQKPLSTNPWFEWGAKILDKFGLLSHGSSIDNAQLTVNGRLLLRFLQDFGTESWTIEDRTNSHPFWTIDRSWGLVPYPNDAYEMWLATLPK